MKVKTIFFTALTTAALTLTLPYGAFANTGDKSEHVIKALNLTGDKADRVEEIMESYEDDMKALKEQKKTRLDAVLTDEEMEQLEAMHDAKKDRKKKSW